MRASSPTLRVGVLRRALLAGLCAACCGPVSAAGAGGRPNFEGLQIMSTESTAALVQALALPDEDFFALDGAATTALQARLAAQLQPRSFSGPPGASRAAMSELRAIGAPTRLDWTRHASFPMLMAEVRSNEREWAVHSAQNRFLVLSNLDTGDVEVRAPIQSPRRVTLRPPSRGGQPPDPFNAALSSIVVQHHDLLRWFDRERLQGRLALSALEYDLVSNTVVVSAQIAGKAAAAVPPARFSVRAVGTGAAVSGVTLAMPDRVRPAEPALLRAALHLRRAQVAVVGTSADVRSPVSVAATLVLVQLDREEPVLLHLTVPAMLVEGAVAGAFELDLRHVLTAGASRGIWLAYLVVGGTVTGPQTLRIELP